ncbi:PAB-dependent poly(A)-specific ribonuclease subunit PAN3, partial [Elysia marginata]
RGGPRPRSSVASPQNLQGKPFNSPAMDQLPDGFAALNLATGPAQNKPLASGSEFEPKSPGLPHSSSTSSFASYASMFGPSASGPPQNPASQPMPLTGASFGPLPGNGGNALRFPVGGSGGGTTNMQNGPNILGSGPQQQQQQQQGLVATSSNPAPMAGSMYGLAGHGMATSTNIASTNGLVYTSTMSPIHSPRISPSSSPLASRRMHSPAPLRQTNIPQKNLTANLVQESVGGTTYFYHPDDFKPQNEGSQMVLPEYSMYPGMPSHIVHLKLKSAVPQYFAPDELKMDILNRHATSMVGLDPSSPLAAELPPEVDKYTNLCPLERTGALKPSLGNLPSSTYKAICTKDGLHYCLRRLHGFRLAGTKFQATMESWKKIYHPNVVTLKEVFTTKSFNDNSIVFVYDYHPGAQTLMARHFSSHINGHHHHHHHHHHHNSHTHHYSREHGKGSGNSRHMNNLLPESLIWSYVVQLSSALRAIHAANLAARSLDPTRIIVTGKGRIRINCVGILDIITPDNSATPNVSAFKQDDLTSMGKIILALACNNLMHVQRDNIQSAVEVVQRNYSPDLKNLICYLLQNPNGARSINDVMPMIGARFFTQLDISYLRSDIVEHELAKEIENGRLFRIMVKLGSINERPEYNSEPSWAETGDRFMLKLYRDFLFHQVDENGAPWIDMAHIIQSLNKFDAGVFEKLCLVSRDENSMLVVSYDELKRCFQGCFQELVSQSTQSASSSYS